MEIRTTPAEIKELLAQLKEELVLSRNNGEKPPAKAAVLEACCQEPETCSQACAFRANEWQRRFNRSHNDTCRLCAGVIEKAYAMYDSADALKAARSEILKLIVNERDH